MNNNNSKGVSFTSGFFLLIGLALTGIFVASIIGLLVLKMTSGTISEAALNDPNNAPTLRFIQVLSVLVGMFLPAVITARILQRKPFYLLGYRKTTTAKQVGIVFLIVLVSLFIAGAFGYVNKQIPLPPNWKAWSDNLEKQYAGQVEIMMSVKTFGGYLLSLVLMAFLPALCEETLFRGGLQNFLTRATKSPWLAIIIVSILFSLVHLSFYGFLPRIFLGIVLGLIFYTTGNLWLSITAHFLNNALAVTQVYIMVRQGKEIKGAIDQDLPGLYWGFIAIPLLIILLRTLKKNASHDRLTTTAEEKNF
jgi:membrane protease YdiL (CAAX protease family)